MPESYTICTAKELNRITQEDICTSVPFTTLLDNKSLSNSKLYSTCSLSYEEVISRINEIPEISLNGFKLSQIDAAIMNAIFTIIDLKGGFVNNSYINFSSRDLIKIMKREPNYQPGHKEIMKITKHILGLSATWLSIDLTDNRRKASLKYNRKAPLLHIEIESIYKQNTLIVDQWKLVAIPILYEYASLDGLNRLRTINQKYYPRLSTRKEDLTIVINDYIAIHIENIKKGYYKNKKILYSYYDHGRDKGLFAHCGIRESDYRDNNSYRNKKSKVHKIVNELLDIYVKNGILFSYKKIMKGKKIEGFELIFQ